MPEPPCLECPLFRCSLDQRKPCRFLTITIDEHLKAQAEKLRQQKRDHNTRVRAKRREELAELRLIFSKLLNEYGTFGKHSELMRKVRSANNPAA